MADRWFRRHPAIATLILLGTFYLIADLLLGRLFIDRKEGIPSDVFHHGFRARFDDEIAWGKHRYRFVTNSLGLKDGSRRRVSKDAGRRIVFVGDSFAEGIGVVYEETYAGIIDRTLRPRGWDVLNAGVRSYSPKLDYLKIRHLVEVRKIRIDELVVFIDLSDVQDETGYAAWTPAPTPLKPRLQRWLLDNSVTYSFYVSFRQRMNPLPPDIAQRVAAEEEHRMSERSRWDEPAIFDRWGREGLRLAEENMGRLADLCKRHGIRMTIVVYPWKRHILARQASPLHVTAWARFSASRGLGFVNCYPDFLAQPPEDVIRRYFIPGDEHWNAEGHALMARILLRERDWLR